MSSCSRIIPEVYSQAIARDCVEPLIPMHSIPTDLALRHLTEVKNTLENLITASESFDYPKAKAALDDLKLRLRALARAKAEIERARQRQSNMIPAEFGSRPQL